MPPTWTEPAPKPSRRPGLFRRTLRNRWLGIVAVWSLGAAVLSLAAHVYLPPSYKAYAILRCTPATNDFFGAKSTEEPFDVYMQTRVSLITSPNVLTAAASQSRVASLKRIATAKDVVQELRKVIHVSVIPATYLIEVSMKSPDPYEATVVVNAVVDSFLATNVKWDDGMTATQIKTLENYLKKLEAQTEELERKWKQLVERGDTDGRFEKTAKPEELGINRAGITLQKYKRVRAELFEVDMELAQAQAWLASARAAAAKAPIPGADQERLKQQEITRRFQADTEVRELALKLKAAQDKLDDARRVVDKPDDPAELAAVRKLAGLKKQYNELWAAKSRVFREEIEQGMGQDGALTPAPEVRDAETKVKTLLARQTGLKMVSDSLEVDGMHVTTSVEILLLTDKQASLKDMQEHVNRRLEQLRFESKGQERIRLVPQKGALMPTRPIFDHRPWVVGAGYFVVLLLTVGFFTGVEARSSRKPSPVEHELFFVN